MSESEAKNAAGGRDGQRPDHTIPVSFCVLGAFVLMLATWWGVASHRQSKSRELCRNHLEQIALALRAYHEQFGAFPPAYLMGPDQRPRHSWRVLILPFLGHQDLYNQYDFDQAWDSAHNNALVHQIPDVYVCPTAAGRAGITNYFAVLGRATAWPEQYSTRLEDFHDGASESILLVESSTQQVPWTSPTDLTAQMARYRHGPSSTHETQGEFLVAMADGTTRLITNKVTRDNFRTLLSINGGRPLAGVDWPQPRYAVQAEMPPPRPADTFKLTDILPYPTGPISANRNYVYCATFAIAWEEAGRFLGRGPLHLEVNPPLAAELGRFRFDRRNLSEDSFIARAGAGNEAFRESLRSELEQKFPDSTPLLIDPDRQDHEMQIYAYLSKSLPFSVDFELLYESLKFTTSDGEIAVKGFGAPHPRVDDVHSEMMESQVTILDYVSDDDFVIRLAPVSSRDEIILAKVAPQGTLQATIEAVGQRIKRPDPQHTDQHFLPTEPLAVPRLTVSVSRQFSELIGRGIVHSNLHVTEALQVIKFELNEHGARLESEALILGENGHIPHTPAGKRKFLFDRPFLIYLIESSADQPYFAAWMANTELMERARQ